MRLRRLPPALLSLALLSLVLLVVLACAGCGGGASTADEPIVPTSPGQPSAQEPLVVLVRYGGIAGTHDSVTVEASGRVTVLTERTHVTRTRVLPVRDLLALRTDLERADVANLRRNYLDRSALDAFQYDITYRGVTVTADEGVVPVKLRPVVDLLARLLD